MMRVRRSAPVITEASNKAAESVENVDTETKAVNKQLARKANEYAHELQQAAYSLGKAKKNYTQHVPELQDAYHIFNASAHDVLQSVHDEQPDILKHKLKKSLETTNAHLEKLDEIDVSQKGGEHIKKAVNGLLKSIQKLGIHSKFFGKTTEDIKSSIDAVAEKFTAALKSFGHSDEKAPTFLVELYHKQLDTIKLIEQKLDKLILHENDPENKKILNSIVEKLHHIRKELRSTLEEHEKDAATLKEKLEVSFNATVDEIRKLLNVKQEHQKGDKSHILQQKIKAISLDALAGSKNMLTHLTVFGESKH